MTKALIVDDHPIVREACERLLKSSGVETVSQASSPAEAFRIYRSLRPDVIVSDLTIRTGVLDGISLIRRLRLHDKTTPVLVLSMHMDPVIISRTLEVGATGYLLKTTCPEEFIKAFHRVSRGTRYVSHEIASELAFMELRGSVNPLRVLTLRELHTLALIADGKSYGSIAEELHSYKTIANTASQIKTKLGAKSLPELMRIGIAHLPSETGRRSPQLL